MKAFMDDNFLLDTGIARELYHSTAANLPIIDYHCHISPREIWEDRRYDNITQVWLGGDHYKWRLMRFAGVPEKYITGDAPDREKFLAWAKVLGRAAGNPLYHWSHLELRRFFGYEGILNEKTAQEVWELCNAKLAAEGFSVRGLIRMSNVETICTTDDPADTLEWHEKIARDASFTTKVLPAWRPDRANNLEKPDYTEYLAQLSAASGVKITTVAGLKEALRARMDFFASRGCTVSDHGLNQVVYAPAPEEDVEAIFAARLAGKMPDEREQEIFKTAMMLFLAQEYRSRDWVMQLHYSCLRNNNPRMFRALGPDTGFDTIDSGAKAADAAAFLGALEEGDNLPKTILYSLNPADNLIIDTLIGCFENDECVSKVQHGSAWWFNDHLEGMENQMKSLASVGYLAGFVGMLTDSRSFLSYPRHEYFRRILCRLLGHWVEEGLYPEDMDTLKDITASVSYLNAKNYFRF